jgi:hypothetical protein
VRGPRCVIVSPHCSFIARGVSVLPRALSNVRRNRSFHILSDEHLPRRQWYKSPASLIALLEEVIKRKGCKNNLHWIQEI